MFIRFLLCISLLILPLAMASAQASDLFEAARSGTPEQVIKALKGGGKLTQRDKLGRSPLLIAAAENPNPEVIEALLKAGARLIDGDAQGANLLVSAVSTNPNPEVVRLLLGKGLDPLTKYAKYGDPNKKFPWELALNNPALRDSDVMVLLKKNAYRLQDFVGTWVSLRQSALDVIVIEPDFEGTVDISNVSNPNDYPFHCDGKWTIDLSKHELGLETEWEGETSVFRVPIVERPDGTIALTQAYGPAGKRDFKAILTRINPAIPMHPPLGQDQRSFGTYSTQAALAYPEKYITDGDVFLPWIESVDRATQTVQLGGYFPSKGSLTIVWDDDVVLHGGEGLDKLTYLSASAYPYFSFRHQFAKSKVSFGILWMAPGSNVQLKRARFFHLDLDTWPQAAPTRAERIIFGGTRIVITDQVVQVIAPRANTRERIIALAEEVRTLFPDTFDFLFVAPWVQLGTLDGDPATVGTNHAVWNDVKGIGRSLSAGTPSKLRSRIELVQASVFQSNGWNLLCHEIAHAWGNFVLDDKGGHTGFATTAGILGGFDERVLKDLGNGTYLISWDEQNFTQVNKGPYSRLELYLMGLAPADEVLPIRVFENATKLPFEDWNYSKFTATGSHVVRIEDIVKKYGPRVPAYGKAPTQFRGLVVVVVDRELSAAELDDLNQNLAGFSDPQPLNFGVSGHWEVMNFASATRGRSAMKLDGLLGLLKP